MDELDFDVATSKLAQWVPLHDFGLELLSDTLLFVDHGCQVLDLVLEAIYLMDRLFHV